MDSERCPAIIRDELAIHISYNSRIMQYALENWPESYEKKLKEGKSGAYYYTEETYKGLGL